MKNVVVAVLICMVTMAVAASAQTFETVVAFDGSNGGNPLSTLIQGTDGSYYGTTQYGGSYNCGVIPGCGTIFKVSAQGKLTTLYNFCPQQPCADGISPWAGLVLGTDGNFYGTTYSGGDPNSNAGTVFKMTPTGKLTTLYTFCRGGFCAEGAQPSGQLIQGPDGNFYGTARTGGDYQYCAAGCGTVFKITPTGTFTLLYAFTYLRGDGAVPSSALTLGPDGNFYGTTSQGGIPGTWCVTYLEEEGCGTVFKMTPNGLETVLYDFCQDGVFCVADGALPFAGLVLGKDGNFYGVATSGAGSDQSGAIFKITSQGQFTELYQFCSQTNCSDGSMPGSALIQGTDGAFYSTTLQGGSTGCFSTGCGTVFRYSTAGGLHTIHTFQQSDGFAPNGLLQATGGYFLGTAYNGDQSGQCFDPSFGCGTAFAMSTGLKPFVTFVQNFAKVDQTGQILGQGFTGTTSVEVNGVSASFTVVSATFIRFTVPQGATTGYVKVTTPTGTLTSNVKFAVLQ